MQDLAIEQYRNAAQQPEWNDLGALCDVVNLLATKEPLATFQEVEDLRSHMAGVSRGEAFIIQAGDCAERLDVSPREGVERLLKIVPPMAATVLYAGMPVVMLGRIGGQFAKPRSSATETQGDITLPSFRGDIVNGREFSASSRRPNPTRIYLAYHHALATRHALLDLAKSPLADLEHVQYWNNQFARETEDVEFQSVADDITKTIRFMRACGMDVDKMSELHEAKIFTSHEFLLLPYEQPLIREDEGRSWASSAHMLWVGERTRQAEGIHVGALSGVINPVGAKIGPTATPDDIQALHDKLNPNNEPGKLIFIARMGAEVIANALPELLRTTHDSGYNDIWMSDPMHGNTIPDEGTAQKTRRFSDVTTEVDLFMKLCRENDVWPGGIHIEATGSDVTECLGGTMPYSVDDLTPSYDTQCDPRLNRRQSLELAFLVRRHLASA